MKKETKMSEDATNATATATADNEVEAVKEIEDTVMAEDDTKDTTKTDYINVEADTATEMEGKDVEPKVESATKSLEESDESLIDVKVCKEFDDVPYIGEIVGVRTTKQGPLYKVIYRDGDQEEFSTEEVLEGKEKYLTLQTSMWNCMIDLVEDLDMDKLKEAGITTISDLELFGSGATKPTNSTTPFDTLDMPLKTKQQLYITATYLLNDQILTKDSKLDDMARFNLSKTHGTTRKSRESRKKKSVVKAAVTVKKADKPVSRTTKASRKASETTAKVIPPGTTRSRGRPPRVRADAGPTTTTTTTTKNSGPPKDTLEGVAD
jgi:hypothetical protein